MRFSYSYGGRSAFGWTDPEQQAIYRAKAILSNEAAAANVLLQSQRAAGQTPMQAQAASDLAEVSRQKAARDARAELAAAGVPTTAIPALGPAPGWENIIKPEVVFGPPAANVTWAQVQAVPPPPPVPPAVVATVQAVQQQVATVAQAASANPADSSVATHAATVAAAGHEQAAALDAAGHPAAAAAVRQSIAPLNPPVSPLVYAAAGGFLIWFLTRKG